MLELFKSSFIISLFTSIFVVIGIKLINLFTEKKSDKNNDKDDFDKKESSDNSYTSDYSYMNGNIIDGYYNLMYLLPDIFKKVNTIDDIMIAFYDVVSNMDKYNQYVEKSSRTPEEDAGELLERMIDSLKDLINQTDKFSIDLLLFDENSYNKYVEFCKYMLNMENAKERNYKDETEKRLKTFMITLMNKFSLNKNFDRLDWFTEERFQNVDFYKIKEDEMKKDDTEDKTKCFIS